MEDEECPIACLAIVLFFPMEVGAKLRAHYDEIVWDHDIHIVVL